MPFKDKPDGATHYKKYNSAGTMVQYYFKVIGPLHIEWWDDRSRKHAPRWVNTSWGLSRMEVLPLINLSIEEKLLNAF